jgi:hypothetical protein
MASTTNYNWSTPDDTALVKDGAAAIRTLGSSIDTTTKALNPSTTLGDIEYRSATANTNTRLPIGTNGQVLGVSGGVPAWVTDASGMSNPMTTTGDTIYSSSGSTPARLAIGSTGNVLTVAGGVPTWAAPAGANPSFSLLSTTDLSAGAATYTVSGLSGYNTFYMIVKNASSTTASTAMRYRVNGNTGTIYNSYGLTIDPGASYATSIATQNVIETTSLSLGVMSSNTSSQVTGYIRLEGCNSSGLKMIQSASGVGSEGNAGAGHRVLGGFINTSSVISSITFYTDNASNFDVGTLRIYGSVA